MAYYVTYSYNEYEWGCRIGGYEREYISLSYFPQK
jgi:hypothetical protein